MVLVARSELLLFGDINNPIAFLIRYWIACIGLHYRYATIMPNLSKYAHRADSEQGKNQYV
jgi:hypothetical protein